MLLFCYGANGPEILSERIKVRKEHLLERTFAAEARGWSRAFANNAETWENTSPSTILK